MRKALIGMPYVTGFGLAAVMFALPVVAEPPTCDQAAVGTVACFERKLCSCQFDPGGNMTGLEPGFRWDCGILRPACEQGGHDTTLSPEALWYLPQDLIVDGRQPKRRRPRPF